MPKILYQTRSSKNVLEGKEDTQNIKNMEEVETNKEIEVRTVENMTAGNTTAKGRSADQTGGEISLK